MAKIRYSSMIQDINSMQVKLENASQALIDQLSDPPASLEDATKQLVQNADAIVSEW